MDLLAIIASRLRCVRRNSDATIQAQCPACAAEGSDKTGNHLRVWPSGAFNCSKAGPLDKVHNRIVRSYIRPDDEASHTAALLSEVEYIEPDARVDFDKVYPESMLDKLVADYSYWTGRGISEDVLRRLGGGVAPLEERSKLSGRYIHPARNGDGKIVGFAGRLIKDNSFAPRWKILGAKSAFIFPHLSISSPAVRAKSEVILVEGIGCALSLMTAGFDNVWCLFGINLSSKLLSKLVALSLNRIIIATNNEASGVGERAALGIKQRLSAFIREDKMEIRLPTEKDFAEMTTEHIIKWYSGIYVG